MKAKITLTEECDSEGDEARFLRDIANRHNYKNAVCDFNQMWRKFKYDESTLGLDTLKKEITFILDDNDINLNELE